MKFPIRVQIDNSVRYNVHLVVLEDESYLEIKDRFKGTVNQVPVARKKIPVKIHFYKSRWLYRKWMGIPYGHVNLEIVNFYSITGKFLNLDLNPLECGILDSYPLKPDKTIEAEVSLEDLRKAIQATTEPLSLFSIFKHNCFTVVAKALGGSTKETVTNLLKGNV